MKKLFLFVAVAALTLSCSKDDDAQADSIKFKINGTQTTMTNINVDESEEGEDTYLTVVGSVGGQTDARIMSFTVYQGDTGADAIEGFNYSTMSPSGFYMSNGSFASDVDTNSSSRLKGTFSGTMTSLGGGEPLTITDGSFNVSH